MMPKIAPKKIALGVNSGIVVEAGTNGSNFAGLAVAMTPPEGPALLDVDGRHRMPGGRPAARLPETLVLEGRHRLSLKVTRQAVSPATYRLSGRVEAVHKVNGVNVDAQSASCEESVTLATGDAWTGTFEIRAWRG